MKQIPIPRRFRELDVAIRAARQAGDTIMDIYRKGFETAKKADNSPVTEADLKSHEIIMSHLSQTGYGIISEEGYNDDDDNDDDDDDSHDTIADDPGRPSDSDAVWIVDPLDGTNDFVERTTGEFTVMIALVRNGRPVLGVIDWPAGGTLFAAQQGYGAFRYHSGTSWQRISVSNIGDMQRCRMIGSRHHLSDKEKLFIKGLGVGEFTNIGSSLKATRISSGDAEAYLTTTDRIKEWDTAASHCIVTESGGRMTDMLGHDIIYNGGVNDICSSHGSGGSIDSMCHKNGILITNGLVHDRIVEEFGRME